MTDKKVDNLIINKLTKAQYDAIQGKSDTELYLVPDDIVTAQWGVVSQTQTWTQAADGGYDYTMSGLVYGWIPKANIDLYEAAGAVFNEQSGYFELNGLEDISYEEMIEIVKYNMENLAPVGRYRIAARTCLRSVITDYVSYQKWDQPAMAYGTICEVAALRINNNYSWFLSSTAPTCFFFAAYKLKKMIGKINVSEVSSIPTNFLERTPSLEEIFIFGLKASVKLGSARLNIPSIVYVINNEASTSPITITLHPTAYARAIADSDVQAALQAHTNVSLASA